MTPAPVTQSPEWGALVAHRDALLRHNLSDIVLNDEQRLQNCTFALEGLSLNCALNFVTPETLSLLMKLAAACDVAGWRERMWRGDKINTTENRAALHVALRATCGFPVTVDGKDVGAEVKATRQKLKRFVAAVRDGTYRGATAKPIKHVVNIGIGGSDLGPRLAARALAIYETNIEAHFIANADAFEFMDVCAKLDPAETLFVIVSKTFTTLETLLNAQTAQAWIIKHLGAGAVAKHFVAVSTNLDAVKSFGIDAEHVFPMWDWVGGRYSLWSAVGLSLELAIGSENFELLLQGAGAMDAHFKNAPLEKNLPVILAMLGVWARNFLDYRAHAVLPYSERLHELPRFLQQLEMESNGKSVSRDGAPVELETCPVIFGESGTVGQHSFHQWLHQGTDKVSADFIAIAEDDLGHSENHRALLSNLAAQASAFAFGQPQAAKPQDVYAGNRSSTIITLDRLDPYRFGMLLALYEHKVFVQSVIWNINPFDQPGVELGKKMALALASGTPTMGAAEQFAAKLFATLAR